jgi:hypothetical protein
MFRNARIVVVFAQAAAATACGLSLRHPSIGELRRDPWRYQDRPVSIDGVVTTSWGLPLVPFRFYKVEDGTGEVTVLSNHGRTPARGARVRVRGRVEEVAVLGGQALGLHVREERLNVRR